ncbi:hypothetical protein EBB07_16460 [Paenibacillaceae bacterium]|nr:hypothetical protein EBB07_16460 [Paenibacillaceae bacterium]
MPEIFTALEPVIKRRQDSRESRIHTIHFIYQHVPSEQFLQRGDGFIIFPLSDVLGGLQAIQKAVLQLGQ